MAVAFTDYLCGVGDHYEPSESFSSALISASSFQGQRPHPSLGALWIPLPSCLMTSTDTSFLCVLVSCLLQGLQEVLISFLASNPGFLQAADLCAGASAPTAATLFVTKQPLSLHPVMIHGFHQLMETRPHLI